jgi:hypothetical protein
LEETAVLVPTPKPTGNKHKKETSFFLASLSPKFKLSSKHRHEPFSLDIRAHSQMIRGMSDTEISRTDHYLAHFLEADVLD